MRYSQAMRYIFTSPKWFYNLFAGAVASLVPVVGDMVLLGYFFEIVESMHLQGEEKYPDFDTNRLMNYLMRGLWPYLVGLIVGLIVIMPLVVIFVIVFVAVLFSAMPPSSGPKSGPPPGPPMGLIFGMEFGFMGIVLLVMIPLGLVVVPLMLRAGLSQDFRSAFSWAWVRDFIGRMWGQVLLMQLFVIVYSQVAQIVGLLACCVGVLFARPLVMLTMGHLWHQLYQLYLERGGTPIPLKVQDAGQAPVDTAET
jgi:hypothetical protein